MLPICGIEIDRLAILAFETSDGSEGKRIGGRRAHILSHFREMLAFNAERAKRKLNQARLTARSLRVFEGNEEGNRDNENTRASDS